LSGAENRDALATGLRTLAEILAGPPQPGPGIV
jgi:hypothetical protein